MSLDDLISDVSALGGLPVYLVVSFVLLLTEQVGTFWRLILGLLICYVIISGARSIFIRDRPKAMQFRTWWEKIDAGTVVSMHSMRAVVLAMVIMSIFRNIWVSTFLVVLALLVSSTRILMKKHYLADVAWGVALGVVVGIVVLWVV